jgi:uncharacterized protein YbaR (Trm112 family)
MASRALRQAVPLMCSPVYHRRLRLLTPEELEELNTLIRHGLVKRADESTLEEPLRDALITDNVEEIYPVWNGVPVIQVFEVIDPRKLPMQFSRFEPQSKGSSQLIQSASDGSVASKSVADLDPS